MSDVPEQIDVLREPSEKPSTEERARELETKPKPSPPLRGRTAIEQAAQVDGLEEEVTWSRGADGFDVHVEWTDDKGPAGRVSFTAVGDTVTWTGLWLEKRWRRRGVYRHVVKAFGPALEKAGVSRWRIVAGPLTDEQLGVYERSGFERDGAYLVADRSDPDGALARWAES